MRTKNYFELRGYVGADPEVKNVSNDKKVINLSIATGETYTDKKSGEKVKTTDWHTVSLWNGNAEIAEKYIKKGSLVAVEGKIKPRSYEDNNNAKKYTIDLVVDRVDIILNKESE